MSVSISIEKLGNSDDIYPWYWSVSVDDNEWAANWAESQSEALDAAKEEISISIFETNT